jgi:hypothetical protein
MLALFATLCLGNLFLAELGLAQWGHVYAFGLGCVQVFVLRWLWPQLFDQESEWVRQQRALSIVRIPREFGESDGETVAKM